MKYYLIVGEASGDLHASHLMAALKEEDLAYMGFIPVLLHLRTIFANMKRCKEDIVAWQPDVLILVDYPGFNLDIAKFVHANTRIPVFYYISPKIWAWKEYRIKNIKRMSCSPSYRSRWSFLKGSTGIRYIMSAIRQWMK